MIDLSNIKIIGVGGAGVSILNAIKQALPNGSFAVVDTDANALAKSDIENKICLIDGGEGAGGDISIAEKSAIEHAEELEALIDDTRLVVLVAGLGGGTASVVAPMLSKIASAKPDCNIVSFTVSALAIEGEEKTHLAKRAQNYLAKRCVALFTLPNDIILARQNLPITQAYASANAYIVNMVCSLAKMLSSNGIVNIDFPTFVKIFSNTDEEQKLSYACFGRGFADSAVDDAIAELQKSPLLPPNFSAKTMLLSLRCSPSFEMNKMQRLLELASQTFGSPAKMAFGAVTDESLDSSIEVCAIGLCKPSQAEEQQDANTFSNSVETDTSDQPVRVEVEIAPPPVQVDVSKPPVPVEQTGKKTTRKPVKQKAESETDKNQTEFKFMELSEQRGFFLDTPPNYINGVDLDIPTYLRKNINVKF